MNRNDFLKLVGIGVDRVECLPVAFLLCNGYACAGYYHTSANEDLETTCVLLNAQLIELRGENKAGQPTISNFNDFLEEIAVSYSEASGATKPSTPSNAYGKTIPLAAIPFDQIAVVYPVAHIGALMRRAEDEKSPSPRFLDLGQSEIIHLLRTKLW
jgi:hypothetical protein